MTSVSSSSRSGGGIASGLLLAVAVAGVGFGLHAVPGLAVFSPMILAILVGMALANLVPLPAAVGPGLAVAVRPLLRAGIVLLGLQITPAKMIALGATGLAVVAATLLATFLFTARIGRLLGLSPALSDLVAAGTSICGASAVVATNGVVDGTREEVAHAVAVVTLFGTLSMFAFPAAAALLDLAPHAYGLWAGSAIHEIAQVVGAGFQRGPEAGEFATVTKLVRVALMAPLVVGLGMLRRRGAETGAARPPFPWFVLGFLALAGFGGVVDLGAETIGVVARVTTVLLTIALGAMGTMVDARRLVGEGLRVLALGALSWVFVSGFALAAVVLVAPRLS